jgi:hypothetical protein
MKFSLDEIYGNDLILGKKITNNQFFETEILSRARAPSTDFLEVAGMQVTHHVQRNNILTAITNRDLGLDFDEHFTRIPEWQASPPPRFHNCKP